MRKKHSFLAVPLLLSAVLAVYSPEVSALDNDYFGIEDMVIILDLMSGDEEGNLNLSSQITRAEFVAMVANQLVSHKSWVNPIISPYPDVSRDHWAAPYVAYGVQEGLVTGYTDGTFRPNNPITLGEASVMMPYILGYTSSDFTNFTMDGRVSWMSTEGLLENVKAQVNTDVITREDTMHLFYNAMTADLKSGSTIFQTMGYSLTEDGEIDTLTFLNELMEGPIVVSANWENQLPFALDEVKSVVIDGKTAYGSVSEIEEHDLVYWIDHLNSLWVYQKEVTGRIESISGTTINIAGSTYNLETDEAIFALSNLGTYKQGDWVTALFGKEGGIAQFVSPSLDGSTIMVGVVTDVGTMLHTDSIGGTYEGPSVTVFATDGVSYTFGVEEALSVTEGAIMEVTVDTDGEVKLVNHRKTESVQGYISKDGTTMGKYTLAEDIQILDVYENTGATVSVSRVADRIINSDEVAYHRYNTQGQIDRLILKDVTGEMHTYAVLDRMAEVGSGMAFNVQYDLVVDGMGKTSQYISTRYNIDKGAVLIKGELSALDNMVNLRSGEVMRLDSASAVIANQVLPLAEHVVFWEKQGSTYYQSTLQRMMDADFESITGYYVSNSDRYIRVLVGER